MVLKLYICISDSGLNSTVYCLYLIFWGLNSCRGVIPRAFNHIFDHVASSVEVKFLMKASYLEIYNEEVRDLLGRDVKKKLDLHEHPDRGVYVQDLSSHKVSSRFCFRFVVNVVWAAFIV